MTLDSPLHSCLYRILQCEGKGLQIYTYLCYDFSKCYKACNIQGIEVVVTAKKIVFFALEKNSYQLFYEMGCGVSNI
jgi:hypothetical protein